MTANELEAFVRGLVPTLRTIVAKELAAERAEREKSIGAVHTPEPECAGCAALRARIADLEAFTATADADR